MNDRVLELEGVHNFRDFGGYRVAGGGRVRRGWLWRSGQHYGASEADLARIDALGLSYVFDLRSGKEREMHPCRRPAGFSATVHFVDDAAHAQAPHVAAAAASAAATPRQRDAASARAGMLRNYSTMAFRPALIEMMRRQLLALAAGNGPSLVNCMAGKDRTGIAVAMVQAALGIHADDIMADYLLTNTAGDVEARIAAGMETIVSITGQRDEAVMRVLMGVEEEYLAAALAAVAQRHGSVEGYLNEALGVDDAMKAALHDALIEA